MVGAESFISSLLPTKHACTLVLHRRGIALVRELSIAAGGVTCMVIDRVEAWFDEGEVAQLKPRNLS